MHQPIIDGLEAYLAGEPSREFVEHLAECPHCRETAESIAEQTSLVRSLRAPVEIEPSAGFYGRVMERIEAQRPSSIWSAFLEPLFAKRLVYASLALFVILSGIFLSTDTPMEQVASGDEVVAAVAQANGQTDRDTVLVQLSTWHGE